MLSRNQLGFLYMFLSVCAFSMMDVLVKWSENYPVGEVLFFRGICGLIPIFFLIPKEKYTNFYKSNLTHNSYIEMYSHIDKHKD